MRARELHLAQEGDCDIKCRFKKGDGSYIWRHIRGKAAWGETGNVVRLAVLADDVSERKRIEVERDRHGAKLERSNQELDDLAHIASHDLKEPLRAISCHANSLLKSYGDRFGEDGARRIDRLIKLGRRMEKLVADLLLFPRIGTGDSVLEPIDLNAVIAKINLADMMRLNNAGLVRATPLPSVMSAKPYMMTVFQNLITNAIKYNDFEEKIVEIAVDDGVFKDDIFRIFKRLNGKKACGEGTGAGLTFVKKIVENHGGAVWLASTPGEGTIFSFTLDGDHR